MLISVIFLGTFGLLLFFYKNYHLRTNLPRLCLSEVKLMSPLMTIILYNNFTKLYTVFNKFLKFLLLTSFISVFCFFLLTTRVELVNYTSRANIYLSLPSVFYQLNYPAFGHLTSRQGWT